MRVANSAAGIVVPVEVIVPVLVLEHMLGVMVQEGIVREIASEMK